MIEHRTCKTCGRTYLLPLDYAKANPLIRDLCPECIGDEQRKREDE